LAIEKFSCRYSLRDASFLSDETLSLKGSPKFHED